MLMQQLYHAGAIGESRPSSTCRPHHDCFDAPAIRQRFEKQPAVGFADDPRVEADDGAVVGAGADQPANALPSLAGGHVLYAVSHFVGRLQVGDQLEVLNRTANVDVLLDRVRDA